MCVFVIVEFERFFNRYMGSRIYEILGRVSDICKILSCIVKSILNLNNGKVRRIFI